MSLFKEDRKAIAELLFEMQHEQHNNDGHNYETPFARAITNNSPFACKTSLHGTIRGMQYGKRVINSKHCAI